MSYSQVPTASISSQPPPGAISVRPELFDVKDGALELSSSFEIPQFEPITNLSVMNDAHLLKRSFFNPAFLLTRYQGFLQILAEHHLGDPVNFAAVREQSLAKFTNRHLLSKLEKGETRSIRLNGDSSYYEGLISFELLKCRKFLRRLISTHSSGPATGSCIPCEELLQLNFINYIRYLSRLPDVLPVSPEGLDEISAQHYLFRSFFFKMSSALYSLKKEGYSEDIASPVSEFDILVESISKVSHEYIILEKYAIQILAKLNKDSIVDKRICDHLFSLFDLNMKLEKTESLKVLNFNSYFSSQYSWYLAITMPFVRVLETNVNGEISLGDVKAGGRSPCDLGKTSFKESDQFLYHQYFSRLDLKDCELYRQKSRRELVELQKLEYVAMDPNSVLGESDTSVLSQFKPPNFEYLSGSLLQLESESFHVIHSRDLGLQLTPLNYRYLLGEFYRILKKGGILELPLLKSGHCNTDNQGKSIKADLPELLDLVNLEATSPSNIIGTFLQTLLAELSRLFAAKNVSFTPVLLNKASSMSRFLIEHTNFSLHEIIGDLDGYCSRLADSKKSDDELRQHFLIYIRAEKA